MSEIGEKVCGHFSQAEKHQELIPDRFITFAELVKRENIIVDTECGLDGHVHLQIAWVKLRALRAARRSRARSCGVEFKSACAS